MLFAALSMSAAFACGGDVVQTVVGFDAKGERALIRLDRTDDVDHDPDDPVYLKNYGDQVVLSLSLFDLATGKTVQDWPILRVRDRGDLKVRGQRWKAAERDITALGVKVDPELPPLSESLRDGPWTLPSGLKVNSTGWCEAEVGTRTYRLFVEGDPSEEPGVALMQAGCSAGEIFAGPMYLSPGGQWLVVLGEVNTWPTNRSVPVTALQTP